MSKININRIDFEAIQLTYGTAKGQLHGPISNPVEFNGIKNQKETINALQLERGRAIYVPAALKPDCHSPDDVAS